MSDTLAESRARCGTLVGFLRESWHVLHPAIPYEPNWHIDFVCAHLEAISRGTFLKMGLENRLRINQPAGTLKSVITSVVWPAWEWGPFEHPELQYLTTTYREDYALRDSRKMRDLVQSEWYQARWGELVRLTSDGEKRFENDARGYRMAVPFASLTAGRGDRLIIDDPHSLDTAESDAERERVTRRFRETVPDRINDPRTSAIIVMMHRLHEGDLCGVIDQYQMPYVGVVLPMEFEPERRCVTPLGKDPRTVDGELLFPSRWNASVVARDKKAMSEHAWAAQKQQRPTGRHGNMFQRGMVEIVKAAPARVRRRVRAWDFAGTQKKPSETTQSASCGVLMSIDYDGIIYVEHVEHMFQKSHVVDKRMVNLAKQDNQTRPTKVRIPQDPGAAGKGRAEYQARLLRGFTVIIRPVTGDKEVRAEPFSSQWNAGNVRLVQGPWVPDYLDEMCSFDGKRKPNDRVDASSDAFMELVLGDDYDTSLSWAR